MTAPPPFQDPDKKGTRNTRPRHILVLLDIHTYILDIHTYIRTSIHTYIHAYIHTYVDMLKTLILLSSKTPKPLIERGIAARGKGREEEP